MTPDQLRTALATLGRSAPGLAVLCGYSRNSGDAWLMGTRSIPPAVAAWVASAVAWHDRHPVPGKINSPNRTNCIDAQQIVRYILVTETGQPTTKDDENGQNI